MITIHSKKSTGMNKYNGIGVLETLIAVMLVASVITSWVMSGYESASESYEDYSGEEQYHKEKQEMSDELDTVPFEIKIKNKHSIIKKL